MSAICKASEGVDKQSNGPAPVMTRRELAKAFRVSENTITNWVERWACYFYAGAAKPWGKVAIPAWCREGVLDNWKA